MQVPLPGQSSSPMLMLTDVGKSYPNLLMLPLTDVSLVRRARPCTHPGRFWRKIMKLAVCSTGTHPWRRAHNLVTVALTVFAATDLPAQVVFHVSLGEASATAVSGRLLVFAKP